MAMVNELDIAISLIPKLRVCITNLWLYPPTSSVVSNIIGITYSTLMEILNEIEYLTIGESDGEILVNTKLIPITTIKGYDKYSFESFVKILNEWQIKTITFKIGLTYDEIFEFLRTLSEKKIKKHTGFKISTELLQKRNITHISINEWVYQPVSDSDLIVEHAKILIDKKDETKFQELMDTINDLSRVFTLTTDISTIEKAKVEIAQKILQLNPSLIIRFFEEKLPDKVERIKQEIISGFPPENLREIILKIAKMYVEIKTKVIPSKEKNFQLLQLKETINKLLSSCSDRSICFDICRELLTLGYHELIPSWWQKPDISEHALIVSQAKLLSEKDSLAILEEESQHRLPEIFKVLDEINRRDLMENLINKIIENLSSSTAAIKLKNIVLIKKLTHIFDSLKNREIIEHLYYNVIKSMDNETNPTVYSECSDIVVNFFNSLIKQNKYENAIYIAEVLRRHRYDKEHGFVERTDIAARMISNITQTEAMEVIIDGLKSMDDEKQRNSAKILLLLGEVTAGVLITTLRRTEDFGTRQLIAEIIRYLGKGAIIKLLNELKPGLPPHEIIRIVQILPSLGEDDIVSEKLSSIILHPDTKVRIEVVRCLGRLKNEKSNEVLLIGLEDEDNFVLREVINIISERKYREAVSKLIKFIKLESIFRRKRYPEFIEEAACHALGKISTPESYKYLLAVIKRKGIFFRRKSRAVIIAAIFALRNYKNDEVKKTLELISKKERDIYIKTAALNCLRSM